MNLWFRLLLVLLTIRRDTRTGLLDEVTLDLRVLPNDLDALLHMNNGRYLTLMDLGRVALGRRTGVDAVARKRRWLPLVRGVEIEYLKPLAPLQRFRLCSRLMSWDYKWLYIEQRFEAGGEVHARAHVRILFRGEQGNVRSAELLEAMGHRDARPAEPPPADVAPGA